MDIASVVSDGRLLVDWGFGVVWGFVVVAAPVVGNMVVVVFGCGVGGRLVVVVSAVVVGLCVLVVVVVTPEFVRFVVVGNKDFVEIRMVDVSE